MTARPFYLVTHGVVVGMTGSGKTGLVTVLIEEALQSEVPVLVIDVKGDLPNLLLSFPSFSAGPLVLWVEPSASPDDPRAPEAIAVGVAGERKHALEGWGLGEAHLARYAASTHMRVITPGSSAGVMLHVLSALERRSTRWDTDRESARNALSAAISLLLRLLGRDPDPTKSKEHVLLSLLAEQRLVAHQPSDLGSLLEDLEQPPFERVGSLELNAFLSKKDRRELAAAITTLLVSPTFASWREGTTVDVGAWLCFALVRRCAGLSTGIPSPEALDGAPRNSIRSSSLERFRSDVHPKLINFI